MKFLGVRGGHGYTAPECARAQGQRLPIPVTRASWHGRPRPWNCHATGTLDYVTVLRGEVVLVVPPALREPRPRHGLLRSREPHQGGTGFPRGRRCGRPTWTPTGRGAP